MAEYRTAAPNFYPTGIHDEPTTPPPITPLQIPIHMPKFYIRAASGEPGPSIFNAGTESLTRKFGAETFKEGSIYYNHQTKFLQKVVDAGNSCVVFNIFPENAQDPANIRFWLDVLSTNVPVYERESDGSYKLDGKGDPIPKVDAQKQPVLVKGYKVAWFADFSNYALGETELGAAKVREGIQVNGADQSKQYPIFEIALSSLGSPGNLFGIQLSALLQRNIEFPAHVLNESKAYPYVFSLVKLGDKKLNKPEPVPNLLGGRSSNFIFDKDILNSATGQPMDLLTIVDNFYIDRSGQGLTDIKQMYMYDEHIESITKQFAEAEFPLVDEFTDIEFAENKENTAALNIVSFVNSNGAPYNAIQLVDEENTTRLTANTTNYFGGGYEGTMTNEEYEARVRADLRNYANPLHVYMNQGKHVETYIYDSGFSLETKLEFGNFIAIRKNTFSRLATFIEGKRLTNEEQYALALTLNSALRLQPESGEWGTGTVRADITGFSAYILGSMKKERTSALWSIAGKTAAMMGAADGKWKMTESFDHARKNGKNIIKDMEGWDYDWVPASTRHMYWNAGLNFPLSYGTNYVFFPAFKTICDVPGSTLNSFFTTSAAAHLDTIGYEAWREFTGAHLELSDAELCTEVRDYIIGRTSSIFSNRFRVSCEVTVTGLDAQRGFSWEAVIILESPMMKTAMRLVVNTKRYVEMEI